MQCFNNVRLGPLLGKGGYAKVLRGQWQNKLVAVKVRYLPCMMLRAEHHDAKRGMLPVDACRPPMTQVCGILPSTKLEAQWHKGCTGHDLTFGVQVLVLRISRKRRSTSSDRECMTPGADSANSRLQQITEARIGLQFLHPNIVHVYAYAARVINMDTIMAKVSSILNDSE